MKIIITENTLEKVKNLIKRQGMKNTIQLIGGFDIFCKVININSPMDFLHLFDDLDIVQSEENENWTLFRYKKGDNLMVYNREYGLVFISNLELWQFLENKFGLKYGEIQELTEEWVGDVYNLRGITTIHSIGLDEINNLK